MRRIGAFKAFRERDLSDYLEDRRRALENEVTAEDKNKLLNANETKYIQYLVERYSVDPLILYWDQMTVSEREESIPAEIFPRDFRNVVPGNFYSRQIITYHIPFTGRPELLRCKPSYSMVLTKEIWVEENQVCFDVINWRGDAPEVKRDADEVIGLLSAQATNVAKDIEAYNRELERVALQVVHGRKAILLQQANLLAALGVPIVKNDQVPSTFEVPIVAKKLIVKPESPSTPFSPEFILDGSIYGEILRIVYETGVTMERHPSLYREKSEEALRDDFLMLLTPHFDSVTGETFNKHGKTDILVRHENKNVFVAECKFWKGIQAFHDAVNQILSYLTWRDSKAAIICFVQNKELGPVLQQIESETPNHPCFVKFQSKREEGWFNFEFHLTDDPTRGVQLAVLCFHFPPP